MLRLIAIVALFCSCIGGDDGALPDAAPDAPVCIYDEDTECTAINRTPECAWLNPVVGPIVSGRFGAAFGNQYIRLLVNVGNECRDHGATSYRRVFLDPP